MWGWYVKSHEYFTEFAFAPVVVEEKKAINQDYRLLYPTEKLITTGHRTSDYQEQFYKLIQAYVDWGKQNKCYEQTVESGLRVLKFNIFRSDYSGKQSAYYFDFIKLTLEKIWFILNDKNADLPLLKKQAVYTNLCTQLDVCAPGIFNYVDNAYYWIIEKPSLNRWLGELRTNIIYEFADKHISKYHLRAGMDVHAKAAFLGYAINEGMSPMSRSDKIEDIYIDATFALKEFANFQDHFFKSYTAESMMNHVVKKVLAELEAQLRQRALTVKNGWIPYDKKLCEHMSVYLKEADIFSDDATIFDVNDQFTEIQFNKDLFKRHFLRFNQSKLFKPDYFEMVTTSKNISYVYNIIYSWIEITNKHILSADDVSDADCKDLIAQIVQSQKTGQMSSGVTSWKKFADLIGKQRFIQNLDKKYHVYFLNKLRGNNSEDMEYALSLLNLSYAEDKDYFYKARAHMFRRLTSAEVMGFVNKLGLKKCVENIKQDYQNKQPGVWQLLEDKEFLQTTHVMLHVKILSAICEEDSTIFFDIYYRTREIYESVNKKYELIKTLLSDPFLQNNLEKFEFIEQLQVVGMQQSETKSNQDQQNSISELVEDFLQVGLQFHEKKRSIIALSCINMAINLFKQLNSAMALENNKKTNFYQKILRVYLDDSNDKVGNRDYATAVNNLMIMAEFVKERLEIFVDGTSLMYETSSLLVDLYSNLVIYQCMASTPKDVKDYASLIDHLKQALHFLQKNTTLNFHSTKTLIINRSLEIAVLNVAIEAIGDKNKKALLFEFQKLHNSSISNGFNYQKSVIVDIFAYLGEPQKINNKQSVVAVKKIFSDLNLNASEFFAYWNRLLDRYYAAALIFKNKQELGEAKWLLEFAWELIKSNIAMLNPNLGVLVSAELRSIAAAILKPSFFKVNSAEEKNIPKTSGQPHKLVGLVRNNKTDKVNELLKNCQQDENTLEGSIEGCTALLWAIKADNLAMVKILKVAGANLYAEDSAGQTALVLAAKHGGVTMLQYLLEECQLPFEKTRLVAEAKIRDREEILGYLQKVEIQEAVVSKRGFKSLTI